MQTVILDNAACLPNPPLHSQKSKQNRQDKSNIDTNPLWHLESFPRVRLRQIVLKAPAVSGYAEQQIDERTDRQEYITDNEIFQIQNSASRTARLERRPEIESEHAGQREHNECGQIDKRGFFPAPAKQIHPAGNNVFKHGQYGREGGEAHKYKEQGPPYPASCHMVENVWQRDKDQTRSHIRADTKGKAGRENDQSRHQCHKGIENSDID